MIKSLKVGKCYLIDGRLYILSQVGMRQAAMVELSRGSNRYTNGAYIESGVYKEITDPKLIEQIVPTYESFEEADVTITYQVTVVKKETITKEVQL